MNESSSVMSLAVKANVCSVRYSHTQPHLLAVGSAAHKVVMYDLRQPRQPLTQMQGHRKAVSYVRC